jgi:ferric-dicitrate binding protein FerR (iron transport regulator)
MLNRHGKLRLVLADPAVGKVKLSGVLRGDNFDTLLRLLEEEHGIVARPRANGELVLTHSR